MTRGNWLPTPCKKGKKRTIKIFQRVGKGKKNQKMTNFLNKRGQILIIFLFLPFYILATTLLNVIKEKKKEFHADTIESAKKKSLISIPKKTPLLASSWWTRGQSSVWRPGHWRRWAGRAGPWHARAGSSNRWRRRRRARATPAHRPRLHRCDCLGCAWTVHAAATERHEKEMRASPAWPWKKILILNFKNFSKCVIASFYAEIINF